MTAQCKSKWNFIPKPLDKKVALYPLRERVENFDENKDYISILKEFLSDKINCNGNNIELFKSGTEAIILAIKMAALERDVIVGVPYFFCHRFLNILKINKISYKFYDLDENLNFDENSYNEILNNKCNFVILPHLFSYRDFKADVIKMINDGIYCLIDVCQTYNALFDKTIISHERVMYALSFGHSKPSQSGGGGALLSTISNKDIALIKDKTEFFDFGDVDKVFINYLDFLKYEEEISKKSFSCKLRSISNINAANAYINLSKKINPNIFEKYKIIKNEIKGLLGKNSLKYVDTNSLHFPSILAIHSTIAPRYLLGNELSKLGIETTWYYPPVLRENMNYRTYDASENILILPFSLFHSDHEIRLLTQALRKAVENVICSK